MQRLNKPAVLVPLLVIAVGLGAYLSCGGSATCDTNHDVGLFLMIVGAVALVIALGLEFLEPRR